MKMDENQMTEFYATQHVKAMDAMLPPAPEQLTELPVPVPDIPPCPKFVAVYAYLTDGRNIVWYAEQPKHSPEAALRESMRGVQYLPLPGTLRIFEIPQKI